LESVQTGYIAMQSFEPHTGQKINSVIILLKLIILYNLKFTYLIRINYELMINILKS